jgi:hypothetical protein
LFAGLLIPAGTRIITYKGSILTKDEYNKKILTYGDIEQMGYTLHLTLECLIVQNLPTMAHALQVWQTHQGTHFIIKQVKRQMPIVK